MLGGGVLWSTQMNPLNMAMCVHETFLADSDQLVIKHAQHHVS